MSSKLSDDNAIKKSKMSVRSFGKGVIKRLSRDVSDWGSISQNYIDSMMKEFDQRYMQNNQKFKQEKEAATKIQDAARGFLAKRKKQKEKVEQTEIQEQQAATKIQAATRGFLAKRKKQKEKAEQTERQKQQAATKIQAATRGFLARKNSELLDNLDIINTTLNFHNIENSNKRKGAKKALITVFQTKLTNQERLKRIYELEKGLKEKASKSPIMSERQAFMETAEGVALGLKYYKKMLPETEVQEFIISQVKMDLTPNKSQER